MAGACLAAWLDRTWPLGPPPTGPLEQQARIARRRAPFLGAASRPVSQQKAQEVQYGAAAAPGSAGEEAAVPAAGVRPAQQQRNGSGSGGSRHANIARRGSLAAPSSPESTKPRDSGCSIQQGSGARQPWHRRRRWRQSEPPPASSVQVQLAGCQSAEEVLQVVAQSADADAIDADSAALALGRLADLLRGVSASSPPHQAAAQHPALPHIFRVLQHDADQLVIRDLVAVLLHSARLRLRPPRPMLAAVVEQLIRRLPVVSPGEATHAAWALTKLGHPSISTLLTAIDNQVQAQLAAVGQGPGPQQPPLLPWLAALPPAALVTLLWVCAKNAFRSQPLLHGITQALLQERPPASLMAPASLAPAGTVPHLHNPQQQQQLELQEPGPGAGTAGPASARPLDSLGPQHLSMLFYSLGALRWAPSREFLRLAAQQAQRQLPHFAPQGLSNSAWGLSKLGGPRRFPELRTLAAALAAEAAPRLGSFQSQDLAIMVSAVAATPSGDGGGSGWGRAADPVLRAAGRQLAQRAQQLSERDLAGMLSALATARQPPPKAALDTACCRVEALLPTSFSATSLAWVLWAFARMRYRPPRSLLRRAEAALRGPQLLKLYDLDPPDIARLCWSLAELRHYSGGLLADLAVVLRSMWQRMPPQSMAMVLHSYALQQFTPHELLDAAAEHLAANLEQYTPQAVAVLIWSFGKLGVHPGRGLPGGGPCTPDGTPLMTAVAAYGMQHMHAPQSQPQPQPAQQLHSEQVEEVGQEATATAGAAAGAFSLQGVGMLLWAFATLEHHPGTALLETASRRFVAEMRWAGAIPAAAQDAAGAAAGAAVGAAPAQAAAGAAVRAAPAQVGAPAVGGAAVGAASDFRSAAAAPGDDAEGRQRAPWEAGDGGGGGDSGADTVRLLAVANAAWAFSRFGYADEAFFSALADALPTLNEQHRWQQQQRAAEAEAGAEGGAAADKGPGGQHQRGGGEYVAAAQAQEAQPVTSLAYAAAKLRVAAAPAVLRCLVPVAEAQLAAGALRADEVCQLMWAYASVAMPLPVALLDAAAARLARGAATCDPRLLCMAVHALGCLRYRASPALLDACVRQVAAAPGDVHVGLLAKLLWGCAHVGHEPEVEALEAIAADLYHRLSHSRGNSTVLLVPDLVQLLWALAVLQQYHTQLYRNAAFRVTRLPDGIPAQPQLRRMLREATVLHSCEHRLDPVAADAAAAILPAWMQPRQEGAAAEAAPYAAADGGATASLPPPPQELRAAAEAVCSALQRAGFTASLKQLSFGEYIVLFERGGSGGGSGAPGSSSSGGALGSGTGGVKRKKPKQAAVVPAAPGRTALNDPSQLVGSALVTQRVLAARGLAAVPGTGSEAELMARCRSLLAQHQGEQ